MLKALRSCRFNNQRQTSYEKEDTWTCFICSCDADPDLLTLIYESRLKIQKTYLDINQNELSRSILEKTT